jgi:NAD(P)-dependent dehydrogenase (short-subunit alcohol dehydrogenase family)
MDTKENDMSTAPVAVVTGGASGIGEAAARRFVEAGWSVVIGDISETRGAAVANELGQAARFLRLDVSSEDDVRRFRDDVYALHGDVDAVVNSAGLLQNPVRIADLDMAEYDHIHAVNVRGTLLVNRCFSAPMARRGKGTIINLCSLTSFRPSGQVAYAMGKASLRMLTELMAAELGPKGIRVNAVAPGYTMTPAMKARIKKGERDPRLVIEKSALRRFVEPSEVGNAILFLCSDAASAITGVTLPIDAGWLASSAYTAYASQPQPEDQA